MRIGINLRLSGGKPRAPQRLSWGTAQQPREAAACSVSTFRSATRSVLCRTLRYYSAVVFAPAGRRAGAAAVGAAEVARRCRCLLSRCILHVAYIYRTLHTGRLLSHRLLDELELLRLERRFLSLSRSRSLSRLRLRLLPARHSETLERSVPCSARASPSEERSSRCHCNRSAHLSAAGRGRGLGCGCAAAGHVTSCACDPTARPTVGVTT